MLQIRSFVLPALALAVAALAGCASSLPTRPDPVPTRVCDDGTKPCPGDVPASSS